MNKFELTKKAKSILANDPPKSFELYLQAWQSWSNEFNEWDAFFLVKAMKDSKSFNSNLLREIYSLFNSSQLVTTHMMWLLYDKYVKGLNEKELRGKERQIEKILNIGFQKDFSETDDEYSCPFTHIVFRMIDVFDEKGLNNSSQKMLHWLNKIEPEKLSQDPNTITFNDKEKEYSSPYEKYYSKITKALFETEQYDTCEEHCVKALATIKKFHNNSDLWIRRRLALCKYHKEKNIDAINDLEELLGHLATNKWFVKADIADCYLAEKDYENAIKYGCEAALDEENYSFKVKLFRTLSEAFDGMEEYEVGRSHALLIKSIIEEEDWSVKESHKELFDKFEIFDNEVANFKEILSICKNHWTKQQFAGQEKKKGIIKVIHGSGKSGHVEDDEGNAYFFPLYEVKSKPSKKRKFEGSSVEFYLKEATDQEGQPEKHAANLVVIDWQQLSVSNQSNNLEVGAMYDGKVKNLKDYGIFINLLDYKIDGLVHISVLESSGYENFKNIFSAGDKVKVKVIEITEKGPSLRIV